MNKIKFLIILIAFGFFCVSDIDASQRTKKEKPQTEKIETKSTNNCPVACSNKCVKDPNTCPKVIRALEKNEKEKTKENKENTKNIEIEETKNDTSKVKKK